MNTSRGKILWVDDEINHLKPHIIFLEKKGYHVTTTTNGRDAVELVQSHSFDLILMDQFMPGIDGLETLERIKELNDAIPIILITKSEEEWLMDEAITKKIDEFLVKPVRPTQIFIAAKKILEANRIREDHATAGYLKDFQDIDARLGQHLDHAEWWDIYTRLVRWQLAFDEHRETGLGSILAEQIQSSNRQFIQYVRKEYCYWLTTQDGPLTTVNIIPEYVIPRMEDNTKTCFIVIDSMRLDHLYAIMPELQKYFTLRIDPAVAILPSATPFSRNAIFSGLYPDELLVKYPQQRAAMESHASSLNQYENLFLEDLLKRHGQGGKSIHYHKIWQVDEGRKFSQRISEYLKVDLLAIVINFVDILAHKRSESDVLKEMLPDESGYRSAVKTWFENSWFLDVLKRLSQSNYNVILTSDHGSVRVNRGIPVGADRDTSSGIRYKYGFNVNCSDRNSLVIKKPQEYRLPEFGPQTSYLIATDDVFFVYPTQQHKFESLYKGSFQHGGISLEEMFIPVATLRPKY
ncbi:MAG: response regulator [Fidelibacterota bacterium]